MRWPNGAAAERLLRPGVSRQRFRDHLAELGLGLESRMGQKVELLSGGQRQSLALLWPC